MDFGNFTSVYLSSVVRHAVNHNLWVEDRPLSWALSMMRHAALKLYDTRSAKDTFLSLKNEFSKLGIIRNIQNQHPHIGRTWVQIYSGAVRIIVQNPQYENRFGSIILTKNGPQYLGDHDRASPITDYNMLKFCKGLSGIVKKYVPDMKIKVALKREKSKTWEFEAQFRAAKKLVTSYSKGIGAVDVSQVDASLKTLESMLDKTFKQDPVLGFKAARFLFKRNSELLGTKRLDLLNAILENHDSLMKVGGDTARLAASFVSRSATHKDGRKIREMAEQQKKEIAARSQSSSLNSTNGRSRVFEFPRVRNSSFLSAFGMRPMAPS